LHSSEGGGSAHDYFWVLVVVLVVIMQQVFYVVDKPIDDWHQGVGYVTMDIIEKKLPAPEEGTMIFVCGPPGESSSVHYPFFVTS